MRHQSKANIENKIFFSKFKPDQKIGEGSFGKIYSAHNINTGEKYALKLEAKNISQPLLEQEAYILCYLKGEGIPFIKTFGFSGDFNVLVMELLGKSLEDLFQERGCKFSIKTVCMLGEQMISRLQYVHSKHILHRDIKPDNFLMGTGANASKVYIIDFGLSKKYRSSRTLQHIRYCENKKLTGTARYASIHALKGCEQGRRDDVEAVGYVLMYFLRGSLPWQGLKVKKGEDKYQKIYEKKKITTPQELCAGFPQEFCEFVTYTRSLKFEEEPNYELLKGLLRKVTETHHLNWDFCFDWKTNNSPSEIQTNKENHKGKNNDFDNKGINEREKNLYNSKEFGEKTKEVLNTMIDEDNHHHYHHEGNNININTNNNINNQFIHIDNNTNEKKEQKDEPSKLVNPGTKPEDSCRLI